MVYDPQDVEAALCFLEHARWTHENWVHYFETDPKAKNWPGAGNLAHHREWVLEYQHLIDVFNGLVQELE